MRHPLTTRQVADRVNELYGCQVREWQVRRLFEDGTLPEPPKFGNKRMLFPQDVAPIIDALRDRGWLNSTEVASR